MITFGYILTFLFLLSLVFTIDYFLFVEMFKQNIELLYFTEFILGLDKLIIFFIFGLIYSMIQDYRHYRKVKRGV